MAAALPSQSRLELTHELLALVRGLLRRRLFALGPAAALDETGLDEIELLTALLQRIAAAGETFTPSVDLSPLELRVVARCVGSLPGRQVMGAPGASAVARLRTQVQQVTEGPPPGAAWRRLLNRLVPPAVLG
ncbi:MAG: hypothetical protein AAB289_12740 [Chloroflexota bacterium]